MGITTKNGRIFFCGLMLLALTIRSIVPAGFMPAPTRNGKVEIVICTGSGLSSMPIEAADSPPALSADRHGSGSGGKPSHYSCPYAPVLAQDVPGPASVPPAAVPYADSPLFAVAAAMPSGFAAKPWFAQGPPFS